MQTSDYQRLSRNRRAIFDSEVVLGVVAVVDVLRLLEVEEGNPVLQVTDFVANRNSVSNRKDAVLKGFVKDGDFFEHFWFSHTYNIPKKQAKVKKNFQLFYGLILSGKIARRFRAKNFFANFIIFCLRLPCFLSLYRDEHNKKTSNLRLYKMDILTIIALTIILFREIQNF